MGQYHRHARLTRLKQPALHLLREQGWTLERLAKHLDVPYNEVRRVLYGESRPSTYMRARLVELTGRRIDELLDAGSLPPKRASERCDCDRCTLARARRAEAVGVLL
jgi:transcriptional regulator with XRE-family HTH domain